MGTALEIPWVEKSWAVNRLATCDAPVFWLTMDVPAANFSLYVGAGIPRLARFADTRIAALLVGPGLPTDFDASTVPAEVDLAIPAGEGAVLYVAPEDQSTCGYMENTVMINAGASRGVQDTKPRMGRCDFHELYGDSHSWPQIDKDTIVGAGTFKVALWAYEAGGNPTEVATAKFWATASESGMAEYFAPVRPGSSCASTAEALASCDNTTVQADETACEGAGACTFIAAVSDNPYTTGYPGSNESAPASCVTTAVHVCDAVSGGLQDACKAAGDCTYTHGPASTWGPFGMGPVGEFNSLGQVPEAQPARFYEKVGMSLVPRSDFTGTQDMAPPAVKCSTCPFGTGHSGTPSTECPTGCSDADG